MKATLTNHRQAPRKTRMVTELVKGKRVPHALQVLDYLKRGSAEEIRKLIVSAAANAQKEGKDIEKLVIKSITVDKGMTIKRWRPRWRGMASPIRKERSHVNVVLEEK